MNGVMNAPSAAWIAKVAAMQPEIDQLAMRLKKAGVTVEPEDTHIVGSLPYTVTFHFPEEDAETTVWILFLDHQTKSDVVITNMTTLPPCTRRKGFGSRALAHILRWAQENGLREVRATQIHADNEVFWERNNFAPCRSPNPCNDFVYTISPHSG